MYRYPIHGEKSTKSAKKIEKTENAKCRNTNAGNAMQTALISQLGRGVHSIQHFFYFLDEYSTQHYAAYFAGKNNIELIYGFLEFC